MNMSPAPAASVVAVAVVTITLSLSLAAIPGGLGPAAWAEETAVSDSIVVLHTNLGNIAIEFFPDDAPNHVENFLELSSSGFYDGTIFHRIIPGFMIQGGDPNTISGNPATWGQGGPDHRVAAEFNTIKHDRGIVSMARSTDPDSAGSQFFIVHKASNFLDEQYTVFGRIVTDESFETLDRIAEVTTGVNDRPADTEPVTIVVAEVVGRSDVPDLLDLPEPARTASATVQQSVEDQRFESEEHGVAMTLPGGWPVQTYDKTDPAAPDLVAVGPKMGASTPAISLTVEETDQRSIDDLIAEKDSLLKPAIDSGTLTILSQQRTTIGDYDAYVINAEAPASPNGSFPPTKFRDVTFYGPERSYTLLYSNGIEDFDAQLPRFEKAVDTFEILPGASVAADSNDADPDSSDADPDSSDADPDADGGCLIATAAFGSELAPQVQELREIRDGTLLQTASGTAFMSGFSSLYYSFSPQVADLERQNPAFRELVRLLITPMLSTLSVMEHADSEMEVLGYGIGVILLNIGMYVVAPAVVVYRLGGMMASGRHRRASAPNGSV